ncbi:MAG: hypothetical protein ACXADL_13145 [Candidatus Thorarchaeota archaeon]|jgi:hypothetical protein
MVQNSSSNGIGTIQERSLHSGLKDWYRKPGDKIEEPFEGFIIDIIRGEMLIEIQTRNFTAIKKKLMKLIRNHRVRLVYPIASEKWIVRESLDGASIISRRRSPKKGNYENVFEELVRIPSLIAHRNFSLEVILIQEEEIRRKDGRGSWRRRGWSNIDRKLLSVIDKRLFNSPKDFLSFIPDSLEKPFTTTQLRESLGIPSRIAQKMTYCLRKMGTLEVAGKKGNAILYTYD